MWKENLMSNLLTVGILVSLGIIVYCKIKNVTLGEVIRQIREGMQDE